MSTLWGARDLEVRSLFVAGEDVLLPPPLQQVAMRKRAKQRLDAFPSRVQSEELDVDGEVRLGQSAQEILTAAEEWNADLLVLGSQGRFGASRFLIGSVAEAVLRKTPCDVLLIPAAAFGSAAGVDERIA